MDYNGEWYTSHVTLKYFRFGLLIFSLYINFHHIVNVANEVCICVSAKKAFNEKLTGQVICATCICMHHRQCFHKLIEAHITLVIAWMIQHV